MTTGKFRQISLNCFNGGQQNVSAFFITLQTITWLSQQVKSPRQDATKFTSASADKY